jgi:predicted small lipoprotein YifL
MKKIFALLLVVSSVYSMIGCSSSEPAEDKGAPIDKSKDATTEKKGGAAPSPTQD